MRVHAIAFAILPEQADSNGPRWCADCRRTPEDAQRTVHGEVARGAASWQATRSPLSIRRTPCVGYSFFPSCWPVAARKP